LKSKYLEGISKNKTMAQYKFIKKLGSRQAGQSYPLTPSLAKMLLKKGFIENPDGEANPAKKQKPVKKQKAKK